MPYGSTSQLIEFSAPGAKSPSKMQGPGHRMGPGPEPQAQCLGHWNPGPRPQSLRKSGFSENVAPQRGLNILVGCFLWICKNVELPYQSSSHAFALRSLSRVRKRRFPFREQISNLIPCASWESNPVPPDSQVRGPSH